MITFIYSYGSIDTNREKISSSIYSKTLQILELPKKIEIEFIKLTEATYAETVLDYRFKSRIRINSTLSHVDIIKPLIHELIHINQIYTGKLSAYRNGIIVWEDKTYSVKNMNTMSYDEYQSLPWEMDVRDREKNVLKYILGV